jgi:hypothetical protein
MNRDMEHMTAFMSTAKFRIIYVAIIFVLVGAAIARLCATYTTFTATYDEPFHVACGMQWLDKGTYNYEVQHPPLARMALALGPYLKGLRSYGHKGAVEEGNAILFSNGDYWRNLTLARLGNVPFLILANVVIFLWARRWFSNSAGFWAVLLFTHLPPVLGHAGLATLDIPCAATVAAALYQLMRWLEDSSLKRTIYLALAFSLAFLCKFSSIAFLGACCIVAVTYLALTKHSALAGKQGSKRRIAHLGIAVCISFILLWAGYRFSLKPMSTEGGYKVFIEKLSQDRPMLGRAVAALGEIYLPLTEMGHGIRSVYGHNSRGHESYLLGEFRMFGWWQFFPVVVVVKTPIGLLALGCGGLLVSLWRLKRYSWQRCLTALFPVAILLVCICSRINLGVRHILVIYVFLVLMAGHLISLFFESRSWRRFAFVPVLLACSVVVESWLAHPDYLAYFNQLAGSHPEKILCESDLDWGQDLQRLSRRLKSLGIDEITIGYFGTAPLEKASLPRYHVLGAREVPTGYVAVSVRYLNLDFARDGSFGALKGHSPVEIIGKSIYLFHLADTQRGGRQKADNS